MWDIAPSEFRSMTLREWWLVYDSKVDEPRYGNLRESEVEEFYQMLIEEQEKERGDTDR